VNLNQVIRLKKKDIKSDVAKDLKVKHLLNRSPINRMQNRFKKSFSPHLKSVFCTSDR